VRRFPGSRRQPLYAKVPLGSALTDDDITYRWIVALGGRRRRGRIPKHRVAKPPVSRLCRLHRQRRVRTRLRELLESLATSNTMMSLRQYGGRLPPSAYRGCVSCGRVLRWCNIIDKDAPRRCIHTHRRAYRARPAQLRTYRRQTVGAERRASEKQRLKSAGAARK